MRSYAVLSLLLSIAGSQTIDPSSVQLNLRTTWCVNQKTSCPLLCTQQTNSGSTTSNQCDPKTLDWTCVCAVDGKTPNVSEYSQTIPYYECTEYANQCVKKCGLGNNACSDQCRTAAPCGAQNPTRVNLTSSTASGSGSGSEATAASTSGFDSFGGSGSGAATTSSAGGSGSKSAAITALNLGQSYGLAVVMGGIFAGFALML
jgi:hypothetical protein